MDGAGTARAQIQSIFAALDGITNTTINGTFYVGINGYPVRGNPDGKRRGQPSRIRVELHLYREAVNAGPESTAQENAAAGKKAAFYDTQTP